MKSLPVSVFVSLYRSFSTGNRVKYELERTTYVQPRLRSISNLTKLSEVEGRRDRRSRALKQRLVHSATEGVAHTRIYRVRTYVSPTTEMTTNSMNTLKPLITIICKSLHY